MTDETPAAKPKTRLRKTSRVLFITFAALVVLYSAARLIYRFSGSNEWELVRNEKGIKVYTLKQPGADLTLVRGVTRVRAPLSAIVAWLTDGDTCKESGCHGEKNLESKDDHLSYAYMIFDLPKPFRARDIAMRIHLHQIPNTKEIWADYVAAPEKEPLHDCCYRITNMSNSWRVTPVGNGEVEMEYYMNMDWGGFIPDPLSNIGRPKLMYMQMEKLQSYVGREKYKTARFDYIQEP